MQLRSRRINERENVDTLPSTPKSPNQIKKLDGQAYFDQLYSDLTQPGAYTNKLLKYLRRNSTYSLFRRKRRKFPRRKIITRFPGNIVQSDLIDMQKFSGSNSGNISRNVFRNSTGNISENTSGNVSENIPGHTSGNIS